MNTTPHPGLRAQAGTRTFFRVAGLVLLPVAVAVFVWGLVKVFTYDGFDGPAGIHIAAFIGGLPLIGAAMMLLQAGYLGTAARYTAGETMPVVKDSAAYLSDGAGVLGVGRTVDGGSAAATGPYCRACGVRNDADASFCDGCGQRLG